MTLKQCISSLLEYVELQNIDNIISRKTLKLFTLLPWHPSLQLHKQLSDVRQYAVGVEKIILKKDDVDMLQISLVAMYDSFLF